MSYVVDFENVSTIGLESSPVAEALAGLRANEGAGTLGPTATRFPLLKMAVARPNAMSLMERWCC